MVDELAAAGPQHRRGTYRRDRKCGLLCGEQHYQFVRLTAGGGFEPVWGFSCQAVFLVCCGSLFGAGKPFFVPSPAIRFAERAEGVKGPKR